MENLRRRFTKKKDTYSVIGRVKLNGHCKKHPKHHQSPGVCSLCLREKLTQLSFSNYSSRRTYDINGGSSSASSFSSYVSSYNSSASASSSSCASPMHCFCFTTNGKSNSSVVSIFLLSGNHEIMKSRSRSLDLDVVPRRDCDEGRSNHDKSGFWFKLLHPKSKRMKEYFREDTKLVHSMSIKICKTMA